MVPAWEIVTLTALGALQLGVAYWWWTGPHLEGTRAWVAALFLLNGAATLFNLGAEATGLVVLDNLGTLADRPTNVALLAVGIMGLDLGDRWRSLWNPVLAALAPATALATATPWLPWWSGSPGWRRFFTADLLLIAMAVGGIGLLVRVYRWDGGENTLWCLLLAGVGVRYAELSGLFFLNRDLYRIESLLALQLQEVWILLAFSAIVAALATVLVGYLPDPPTRNRRTYDLVAVTLLAGFLFGVARWLEPDESFFAVTFSLALVRPLFFLEAQSRLDDANLWSSRHVGPLTAGAAGYVACLLGLGVGAAAGFGTGGTLLTGTGFAPLGVLAGSWALEAGPSRTLREPRREDLGPDREWPVDAEEVTLPPDWRERLEAGHRRFQALDADVQDRLAGLAYWERIVLALEGAPEGGDLPPYERTTPGLHLRTHCPYASIGPEIRRANERAAAIAKDLGVEAGPGGASQDLVADGWGPAKGLSSPRAKHYELTPLGQGVAQALRENVGLGEADPQDVARVVGDGFEPGG